MKSKITSFKLKSFERVLRMNDDLEYSVIIPLRHLIELLIFGTQPDVLNQWQTPLCQTLLNTMKVFRNALLNPSDPMYNIVINLNNAPQSNTIIQMTNWYIKILDQQIVALNGNTLLTRIVPNVNGQQIQIGEFARNAIHIYREAFQNAIQDEFAADQVVEESQLANAVNGANASSGDSA